MQTKNILIGILMLVVAGSAVYLSYTTEKPEPIVEENNGGRFAATTTAGQVPENMKTATFSGKLEEVNVGCFVDGECYVVVGGKHVTVVMGWSQETVGSTQGVEGFGDLEQHIGEDTEVYAQEKADGTYTLYGSESFYVKLK